MNTNISIVNQNNFDKEVLQANVPVLVDFWAAWCGPCKMVAPVIDQIASQYEGKVKVVKLNVDENPEIANRYQIMSIPTINLYKNGRVVDNIIGARPKQAFDQMINSAL